MLGLGLAMSRSLLSLLRDLLEGEVRLLSHLFGDVVLLALAGGEAALLHSPVMGEIRPLSSVVGDVNPPSLLLVLLFPLLFLFLVGDNLATRLSPSKLPCLGLFSWLGLLLVTCAAAGEGPRRLSPLSRNFSICISFSCFDEPCSSPCSKPS